MPPRTIEEFSAYQLDTAAAALPVSQAEAKRHLKYDADDRDDDVDGFIEAATEIAQHYTQRQFVTATWKLYLPTFPRVIRINKSPVSAITSIQYVDTDGDTQALSTSVYSTFLQREPAEIHLAYSQSWPTVRCTEQSVIVTFTAGYGAASAVPQSIKSAIKILVEGMFYGCETAMQKSAECLLNPHKVGM